MSDAWKSYPGAPSTGASLGPDLEEGALRATDIDGFGIIVFRTGLGLMAYVNACPHNYMPLTYQSEDILTSTGKFLVCSNHDAVFDAATGEAKSGPVQGCTLDAVPVVLRDGQIVIA